MAKISRIELLKQKLAEEKAKKESGGSGSYSNDIYPFWLMEIGKKARVRILPDLNEDNDFIFFKDRLEHTLSINGDDKKIPCRQMYGEDCPICELSRKWYKEEGKDSKNGKYYYRKKTSLVRVLVLEDPLPPNDAGETYEGKVCNTQFGFQLMEKIKEQISNDDLGEFYDLDEGYDFIISKTKQGEYGTYSVGSQFARNASAIDDDVKETVELIDLSTLLPKDFGYDKVQGMLEAHINGEDYDDGDDSSKKEDKKPVAKPVSAPKKTVAAKPVVEKEEAEEEEADAPAETEKVVEAAETSDDDDGDILAKLRERRRKASGG